GIRVGDTLVQRAGLGFARGGAAGRGAGAGGGGRGGGRGGGGGTVPSQAVMDSLIAAMNQRAADLTFHRLFDGMSLTADQESVARGLIAGTQNAIAADRPKLERPAL